MIFCYDVICYYGYYYGDDDVITDSTTSTHKTVLCLGLVVGEGDAGLLFLFVTSYRY